MKCRQLNNHQALPRCLSAEPSGKGLNTVLYAVFIVLTIVSFAATRAQTLIDDREFIDSMVPHHSGAILMCREADLRDSELLKLCGEIIEAQRREIEQMHRIKRRLEEIR